MGSSLPLRRCSRLRRIGRGQPQTGTNNGGGRASEDDNVEDNNDGTGGSGLSSINNKDGQAGGATRGDDDGMGPFHSNDNGHSTIMT